MIIHAGPLTDLLASILEGAGAEPERARICAEHLVAANLKGHDSHGVGMAPSYVRWIAAGKLKPNARAEVVSDTGAVLVVDGGFGLGQPVAREADRHGDRARAGARRLLPGAAQLLPHRPHRDLRRAVRRRRLDLDALRQRGRRRPGGGAVRRPRSRAC